jgi:hypothetical protein
MYIYATRCQIIKKSRIYVGQKYSRKFIVNNIFSCLKFLMAIICECVSLLIKYSFWFMAKFCWSFFRCCALSLSLSSAVCLQFRRLERANIFVQLANVGRYRIRASWPVLSMARWSPWPSFSLLCNPKT